MFLIEIHDKKIPNLKICYQNRTRLNQMQDGREATHGNNLSILQSTNLWDLKKMNNFINKMKTLFFHAIHR